jgi:hypothetical protein
MPRMKKLKINEYWSKDCLLKTPMFNEIMSRDRFLLLLRMLHFSDNSADAGGDRLRKIRNVIDSLRTSFRGAFSPYRDVVIDESLLLFKGRLSFKQYIPSKRSRFGIKTFVMCDCKTGYILDFIVYTGANSDITVSGLGKGADIVTTLLAPCLQKGHTLFVDNWYSSPDLFLWLHDHATNACGTVRKTRKNMPKMEQKLRKGEINFRSTGSLLALKWSDKREVWMLTTCHNSEMVPTEKEDRKTGVSVRKPKCVVDYNNCMGSVDRTDMLLSSIESIRKTLKWYKKLFFHILDLSILNAHSLYKVVMGKNTPVADFHLTLIREILEKYCKERRKSGGGRRSENLPLRLMQRHFSSKIESTTSQKKSPTRKCVVCSKNNKRRETRYMCKNCDVALCVTPCFETFHTNKNY